jgi:hypothetical protein
MGVSIDVQRISILHCRVATVRQFFYKKHEECSVTKYMLFILDFYWYQQGMPFTIF